MNWAKWAIAVYLVIQALVGVITSADERDAATAVASLLGTLVVNGLVLWLLVAFV